MVQKPILLGWSATFFFNRIQERIQVGSRQDVWRFQELESKKKRKWRAYSNAAWAAASQSSCLCQLSWHLFLLATLSDATAFSGHIWHLFLDPVFPWHLSLMTSLSSFLPVFWCHCFLSVPIFSLTYPCFGNSFVQFLPLRKTIYWLTACKQSSSVGYFKDKPCTDTLAKDQATTNPEARMPHDSRQNCNLKRTACTDTPRKHKEPLLYSLHFSPFFTLPLFSFFSLFYPPRLSSLLFHFSTFCTPSLPSLLCPLSSPYSSDFSTLFTSLFTSLLSSFLFSWLLPSLNLEVSLLDLIWSRDNRPETATTSSMRLRLWKRLCPEMGYTVYPIITTKKRHVVWYGKSWESTGIEATQLFKQTHLCKKKPPEIFDFVLDLFI